MVLKSANSKKACFATELNKNFINFKSFQWNGRCIAMVWREVCKYCKLSFRCTWQMPKVTVWWGGGWRDAPLGARGSRIPDASRMINHLHGTTTPARHTDAGHCRRLAALSTHPHPQTTPWEATGQKVQSNYTFKYVSQCIKSNTKVSGFKESVPGLL